MQNDIDFREQINKSFYCITIKWNNDKLSLQGFTVNASYWRDTT